MTTLREILSQRHELKIEGNEVYCNWAEALRLFPSHACFLPRQDNTWRKVNSIAFEVPKQKDIDFQVIRDNELQAILDESVPQNASGIRIWASYGAPYTFIIPGRAVKKSDTGTFLLYSKDSPD